MNLWHEHDRYGRSRRPAACWHHGVAAIPLGAQMGKVGPFQHSCSHAALHEQLYAGSARSKKQERNNFKVIQWLWHPAVCSLALVITPRGRLCSRRPASASKREFPLVRMHSCILRMDEILHDLETMRNHCSLVFTGESSFQGFFGGARFRPSTAALQRRSGAGTRTPYAQQWNNRFAAGAAGRHSALWR